MRKNSGNQKYFVDNRQQLLRSLVDGVLPLLVVHVTSWIIYFTRFDIIDPFVAVFNSVLLIHKALPNIIGSSRVLLQAVPKDIQNVIEQNLRDATTIDGIISITDVHFWTNSSGVYVGSLVVRVKEGQNQEFIRSQINPIFEPYTKHLCVQIQTVAGPTAAS